MAPISRIRPVVRSETHPDLKTNGRQAYIKEESVEIRTIRVIRGRFARAKSDFEKAILTNRQGLETCQVLLNRITIPLMETARRLGIFSLVVAFSLYVFYDQSELSGIAWRDQLIVYSILFGILGIILLTRFKGKPKRSERFSWIRNLLFRRSEKDQGGRKRRRTGSNDFEE